MAKIDDVIAEVAQTRGVIDSAVELLNQIHQALIDAAGDPAKIQQVIADLGASRAKLAQAIVANPLPGDPGTGDDSGGTPPTP